MSRTSEFLKTLGYGIGVFLLLGFTISALIGWRQEPVPLMLLIIGGVSYLLYRFYQGYAAASESEV